MMAPDALRRHVLLSRPSHPGPARDQTSLTAGSPSLSLPPTGAGLCCCPLSGVASHARTRARNSPCCAVQVPAVGPGQSARSHEGRDPTSGPGLLAARGQMQREGQGPGPAALCPRQRQDVPGPGGGDHHRGSAQHHPPRPPSRAFRQDLPAQLLVPPCGCQTA